jgi:hypothetical protein
LQNALRLVVTDASKAVTSAQPARYTFRCTQNGIELVVDPLAVFVPSLIENQRRRLLGPLTGEDREGTSDLRASAAQSRRAPAGMLPEQAFVWTARDPAGGRWTRLPQSQPSSKGSRKVIVLAGRAESDGPAAGPSDNGGIRRLIGILSVHEWDCVDLVTLVNPHGKTRDGRKPICRATCDVARFRRWEGVRM